MTDFLRVVLENVTAVHNAYRKWANQVRMEHPLPPADERDGITFDVVLRDE